MAEDESEEEAVEAFIKSPDARDEAKESGKVDIDGSDNEKATGDSRGPSPKVVANEDVGSQRHGSSGKCLSPSTFCVPRR